MAKNHGGLPIRWHDAFGPAFAGGSGSAAPGDLTLSLGAGGDSTMDIHVLGYNENTEDRQYFGTQVDHDIYIPSSGSVIVYPHVHFTLVSEPPAGQTVIWKVSYVYAKVGAKFQSTATILTCQTYTSTAGADIRDHLVAFPASPVTIPVAELGPSMVIMYTVKLDTASTVSNNTAALLFADWHYQAGPAGTDSEWS